MRRQAHGRTGRTLWHAPPAVALRFVEGGTPSGEVYSTSGLFEAWLSIYGLGVKWNLFWGQYAWKLELPDDFQEKPPISNFKENRSDIQPAKFSRYSDWTMQGGRSGVRLGWGKRISWSLIRPDRVSVPQSRLWAHKEAGAWLWLLKNTQWRVREMSGVTPLHPYTPSRLD